MATSSIHFASRQIDTGSVLVNWTHFNERFVLLIHFMVSCVFFFFLASGSSIKIWDLESKSIAHEVTSEHQCTSLAWSADGQTLFAGYTDSQIRVFEVRAR